MAVPAVQYVALKAKRGGKVHVSNLSVPCKTVCGRDCDGWAIALDRVDCQECKAVVHYPVKTRARKRRRVA
jgi:hypothetical protein